MKNVSDEITLAPGQECDSDAFDYICLFVCYICLFVCLSARLDGFFLHKKHFICDSILLCLWVKTLQVHDSKRGSAISDCHIISSYDSCKECVWWYRSIVSLANAFYNVHDVENTGGADSEKASCWRGLFLSTDLHLLGVDSWDIQDDVTRADLGRIKNSIIISKYCFDFKMSVLGESQRIFTNYTHIY